jgi:LacI family transcriptional regulator
MNRIEEQDLWEEVDMPTIIDVAREAGVSFKTVSRVYSGEANVRAATREKVRAAAARIGYVPNAAARALRAKAPRRVALLLDNPSRSYSESTQIGAMLAAQGAGAQLVVLESLEALKSALPVSGVLLSPPLANQDAVLTYLSDLGVPFVRIGAEKTNDAGDKIGIDDRIAAREMTDYLIGLGHRRIGFISGDPAMDVSRRRQAGYEDAMSAAGLEEAIQIGEGRFSFESGLEAAESLLSRDPRPTAIFAANDEMASACLAVAYKRNLRVPDMLSVVGFDDAPVSRAVYPALTTVRQGTRDMVGEAMTMLDARMSGDGAPARDVAFPHSLVLRDSTSAPL